MNLPCNVRARRLLTLAVAGALLPAVSLAQTTATAPAATESKEEVLQLTPFEVSTARDKGKYVQEETVAVTKFAVPLINVPQNVFVFNRNLLDDLNTGALRDALAYNVGIQGGLYSTGGSYRGFSNQEKLKDGYKTSAFFDYDPIHFERIELLKGPSAVMYGRTEPGGITNYVTKRPVPGADFAVFTFGTGKNNKNTRKNFNLDINQSYEIEGHNPLDIRITGAFREYQDSRDSQTENGRQTQNSLRVAATHWIGSKTRVYANYMYYKRYFHTQFGRYASFAVGVPQATPGHTIPFSLVYGRDPFEDYGRGREFYWEFNDTQLIIDHKLSDTLDFRFGFNLHKRTNQDYLLNIAATTLNGQGAIRQTGVQFNINNVWYPDTQAHFVWKPAPEHNILVGYSVNWAFEKVRQWFNSRNADGTAFSRTYIPANGIPQELPKDYFLLPTAHNDDERKYASIMLNYLGGFMDEKLHIMAGVAINDITQEFHKTSIRTNPAPTLSTDDVNPQVGAIYKITKDVSVFALASQSTQFTTTRNSFGDYFGPITGDGFEGGLKFAYKNGTINGTLTYYTVDQSNNVVFDPLAESFAYRQSVQAGTPNPALLGDQAAVGTTRASGIEFEVNAAFTPQFNVTFGYAHSNQVFHENPNPVIRGTKVANLEPNKITLMARYDFDPTPDKGFFVGLGTVWIDKVYGGFSPGSNNTKTFYAKGGTRIDGFVGYKFKGYGIKQQIKLQVIGANSPIGFSSGFDPVANDRYYLKAKPIVNLDWTVRF